LLFCGLIIDLEKFPIFIIAGIAVRYRL
jgi:hypothetical protein